VGVFARILKDLASEAADRENIMIDATYLKAQQVTEIAYIRTHEGSIYLTVIINFFPSALLGGPWVVPPTLYSQLGLPSQHW
jgi:hypothetical protein